MHMYMCLCVQLLSCVQLFASPWTVAHQAPLSMGFSRQEYWSGLPFPPPGGHPDPRIEPSSPVSPTLQADSLPLSHQGSPRICIAYMYICICVCVCVCIHMGSLILSEDIDVTILQY